MKRLIAGMVAVLLAAVLAFPLKAEAVSAQRAIMLDADTKRVLYEKKGYERGLIASTTKIMTALIVCEQCNVLDRFRIPKEAVGVEGSSVYLREGEIWTIQDLLYGLMLHSGNDAAIALAIYCSGTVEGFVGLMNDKAHRLGLRDTRFENPHGLDSPCHYSTAYDMAVLAAYAMQNPIFAKTVSTQTVSAGNRSLRNHNKLLWRLDGADGVKTGFTKASGRILVSSAMREGRRLVAVTMNAPNDWQDHISMLEAGFANYEVQTIIHKGTIVDFVDVAGGTSGKVSLVATEDFVYPLTKEENPQIVLQGPGFVYAPAVQGEDAGYAYICIDDTTVGKVLLSFGETIEQVKDEEKSFFQKLFGR